MGAKVLTVYSTAKLVRASGKVVLFVSGFLGEKKRGAKIL
jgi:hypothetical protein